MQQPMPNPTKPPGEIAKPGAVACSKCTHLNAPDSRFCSTCGVPLSVIACQKCDALNPATAPFCHQCNTALQDNAAGAQDSASEIIDGYKPPPRPPIPLTAWVTGSLILAALFFFGFQAYQMFSYVDIPYEQASIPPGSDLEKRRGSSYSGTIVRPATTAGEAAEDSIGDVAPATPPLNAKTAPEKTTRIPAEARPEINHSPAKAATSVVPTPPIAATKPIERTPVSTSSCTAGVWALGLCGAEAVQPKE